MVQNDMVSSAGDPRYHQQLKDGKCYCKRKHHLVERFAIPLKGALADCSKIKEEFESVLQYAVQYISLSTMDYHAVWWRIFNAPTASSVLILVELLLSLPASWSMLFYR